MDKSIKLLLTYLDDKSQDITDNDYLNGCNFLKEYHRENKELTESLFIIQKQLLILTCKVNDLESSIKNNNSNEEILNALHKKVDDMAECLNEVGYTNSHDWDYHRHTKGHHTSIHDHKVFLKMDTELKDKFMTEFIDNVKTKKNFKGYVRPEPITYQGRNFNLSHVNLQSPFRGCEQGMTDWRKNYIWEKYKEVSDWDF